LIATITLNPSLDRHVAVENLILDDTNRWVSYKREPGGKGINVSRVLKELGGRTTAYGFVGGFAGRTLKSILKQQGVPCDFTPIKSEIRSNFIITELKTHCQTRISAPGPKVSDGELKKLVAKVISIKPKPRYMVMAGSVPPGVPYYIYRDLIREIKALGITTVAGLVFKLSGGGSLEEASRFAVAAGTAATLTPGTELCHKRDVDILLPLVTVERLPF